MAENKYIDAKVLHWWRDEELKEYEAIIEINGVLRLITTKVEEPNANV